MLRPSTEESAAQALPVPSGDDAETLHEAARESIRTRIRRATQPLVIGPPIPRPEGEAAPSEGFAVEGVPEVAPVPSAPIELPAPYEPEVEESEDIHDAARKRIRRITQPIEVPLPQTTSASYAPDAQGNQEVEAPRSKRGWYVLFLVALLAVAGVLNYRTFQAAFNYEELTPQQIRTLAPELEGGYVVRHKDGAQFVGHLVREKKQTSDLRADALASQLLMKLSDRGVRKVILLDRNNFPVAIKSRVP